MKTLLFSLVFMFAIIQVQAQCKIASVKEGPSRLEVYDERGSSMTFVQWDGKDAYDYSSCWLAKVESLSGRIYIYLYDGSRNTPNKTVQSGATGSTVKSIKIIGNKIKIVDKNGREYTEDIK